MYICKSCGEDKEDSKYYKIHTKRGLQTTCKSCRDAQTKARYAANPEPAKRAMKAYAKRNPGKINGYNLEWQSARSKAMPSWLSKVHRKMMKNTYCVSSAIGGMHVDHIIPLRGELVCGLHVPWNLQIIPAKDNLLKSNNYVQM